MRRNDDCGEYGVIIQDNGQGVLEDDYIFGNACAGVTIMHNSNPALHRNHINKNGYWAVSVTNGGGGTIEDNDLSGNAWGAWHISPDSEPNLRRARNNE